MYAGDCALILPTFPAACFDSIVTDPPAGISFMNRAWDGDKGGRDAWVAWITSIAAECLRVAKPGAHALVWALPRTSHWTATAWENAGWDVRDRVAFLHAVGFPKSQNVGKTLAQWEGFGTALKPACEDWWLLRKPFKGTVAANVLAHGTGALNIEGCRVPTTESTKRSSLTERSKSGWGMAPNGFTQTDIKALPPVGRWPANVTHDGSEEVLAAFAAYGERPSGKMHPPQTNAPRQVYGETAFSKGPMTIETYGDTGTAARFFYGAKASAADRMGSKHPTVKNLNLLRWLARLITPPGGLVLDPFAGSGTLYTAARREGFRSVLIEQEDESIADVLRRVAAFRDELPFVPA